MRVYLPTTLRGLAELHASGELPAGTDRVLAPDDTEEGEYAALLGAADASAALLDGPGRRVVVVAELADGADPDGPVPLRRVVAVHADTEDRPAGADPDEDLAWFATQEIEFLISG
ncbi:DUF6912 family protein [Nocardioides marmotae]|uniref:DUF6912 family protein n=1 Tax=Nocardioides marmotae TaxID=2663857 RepID=UPI0013224CE8|nr:hypothetical protein [Nocardioides marmotae]MBC9734161.1 hypothetical protein [Nocardioides marmotae]MTB85264.1 hypothetical protein [Nocardioides marmotae]